MLPTCDNLWHHYTCCQDGDNTHRHVHIENPAPAPVIGDPAAQGWSNDRGDTEDSYYQTLPFPSFSRWKDIADDRHSDRHHCACSQALNATVYDQLSHVLTGAGQ